MSDEHQHPSNFSERLSKITTYAAIGTGIGFGTCGVGLLAAQASSFFGYIAAAGGILFFVSLATLILCGIVWFINTFIEHFRK